MRRAIWGLAGAATWLGFFLLGYFPREWMYPIPVPLRVTVVFLLASLLYARMFQGESRTTRLLGWFLFAPALSIATFFFWILTFNLLAMGGLLP